MKLRTTLQRYIDYFNAPNHTLKRFINKAVVQISQKLARDKAYGIPSHVIMEISSACQLHCPLCPIGNDTLERKSEIMKMDTYTKVVDEIGDHVYRIYLNGMGEPTLNHQILPMIEYAKKKNIYVELYTNFQLENPKLIEGLIEAGLDSILIAIDGAHKDTYEDYRVGGKFEAIVANVKRLVESRKKLGKNNPEINVQFIPLDHNKGDLKEMPDFVKDLGADNLLVKRPFLFRGTGDKEKDLEYIKAKEEVENAEADEYSLYKIDENGASWALDVKKACDYLWASSVVLADGSVSPCCFDYDGKVVFGNVNEDKFKTIWNNDKFQRFRKKNREDWKAIPLCNEDFEGGCPNMFISGDDWLVKPGSNP